MRSEDYVTGAMMTLCGALLLLCFVACTQGAIEEVKVRKQLEIDNCSLVSKTETGERFNCGRACTKALYAYEYSCKPNGMAVTTRIIEGI